MPLTLVASDNFDRAAIGGNWSQRNANWGSVVINTSIRFGASAANTNNEAIAAWVGAGTPTNNHRSEVTIAALDFQSLDYCTGAACRVSPDVDGARDAYFAFVAGTSGGPNYTTVFGKVVNGVRTVFHSASLTWAVTDAISISCVDDVISVQKNGIDLGGLFTRSDPDLTTGTWGVVANGAAVYGDNWAGYVITPGGADLAGTASATATATGNLTTDASLAGAATATATATGNLTTAAADRLGALILVDDDIDHSFVDGAGAIDGDPYDPIAAGEALEGAAAGTATAAGAIITSVRLNGVALIVGTASGALNTGLRLFGSAAAVATASGNLTAQVRLSGAAITQALAAAGITTQVRLGGSAAASALAAASITAQIQLNGAAVAQALAAGELLGGTNLAGNAQAQASASAALITAIPLLGAAVAQSQAVGTMSTALRLAGTAAGSASATGTLTLPVNLSGAAAAVVSGSGALTVSIRFNAQALAAALAGGDLVTHIRMSGAAVAQAAASGSLAVEYTPTFNRRHRVHRPRRNLTIREAA